MAQGGVIKTGAPIVSFLFGMDEEDALAYLRKNGGLVIPLVDRKR